MNSKQRRKDRRYWKLNFPHSTAVGIRMGERYFEFDRRMLEMQKWCVRNARDQWKIQTGFASAEFYFTRAHDATLFALKWS